MRTPRHLWIIGILSLLWNAGGAFDYAMTQFQVESYLALLTEPQRAYLESRPLWFDATWAIGVWGSVLGSLLLLARSAWSSAAFLLSLVGFCVSAVWSYGLASPSAADVLGPAGIWFSGLVAAVLLFLTVYARVMAGHGVLR